CSIFLVIIHFVIVERLEGQSNHRVAPLRLEGGVIISPAGIVLCSQEMERLGRQALYEPRSGVVIRRGIIPNPDGRGRCSRHDKKMDCRAFGLQ
ncbi:MAG: hypothetical protein LBR60_04255, partial [Fibrobacter sp.]|nr:hypothetical protein [Fibrobacter sp.]